MIVESKSVSIFVVLLMLSMLLCVSAQASIPDENEVAQARLDAERDVEKYVSQLAWGAVGLGGGWLGVAYAYFATPTVPAGILLGKPPVYVATYTHVYQKYAKRQRMQASAIGCAALSLVYMVTLWLSP